LAFGSLLLSACGSIHPNTEADAPPPVDASSDAASIVSLAVTKAGNGSGTVTSNPAGVSCGSDCLEAYSFGTIVTLTATPDAGSIFDGWKGGGCTGTDPCVVTLATDTSITATFRKQQFTVTVTPNGNGMGTLTSTPAGIDCGSTCNASFDIGTQVTLMAVPSAGTTFVGWTGGGCTGAGSCTVTVTADTAVQPSFALNNSLVVTRTGNGTGTVTASDGSINCGTTCSHQYAPNTTVTLTATASAQSDFTGWAGGACSGSGACVVTMTAAAAATATFTLKKYLLQVNKAGSGTGTVTSNVGGISCGATCSSQLDFNTVVTLTAVATNGSTFTGWSGGGCSSTGSCVQTMTAISTVTANFTCPSSTFTYTGSLQTYVVPACASQVHLEAYGAQGASGVAGGLQGGLGGYAKGDITATPGQTITVVVGGQGTRFNGGGGGVSANVAVANGGDASDIRVGSTSISNRILVAGGGGGGGNGDGSYAGGAGGGGACGPNYCGGAGGKGYDPAGGSAGTGASGGATGGAGITAFHAGGGGGGGASSGGGGSCQTGYPPMTCGGNGGLLFGGFGDSTQQTVHSFCYSTRNGTAGGGGGYYGGGGTSVGFCGSGAGGGGSSYTGSLTNPVMTGGVRSGNGQVIITPF
jgi:hypothetical protein